MYLKPAKIKHNKVRDRENNRAIKALGIRPVRIWEHNLGKDVALARRQIRRALRAARKIAAAIDAKIQSKPLIGNQTRSQRTMSRTDPSVMR